MRGCGMLMIARCGGRGGLVSVHVYVWTRVYSMAVDNSSNGAVSRSRGCCSVERIALCLMTVFFVLAAVAQLNDPDCLLWMCIYLLPAFLTFSAFINISIIDKGWWWLCGAVDLGAHSAFSFTFITAAAKNDRLSWDVLHLEESRESCGLVIVIIWLMVLLYAGSKKLSTTYVASGALVFAIIPLLCWVGYKVYWQMHCDIPEHCAGIL